MVRRFRAVPPTVGIRLVLAASGVSGVLCLALLGLAATPTSILAQDSAPSLSTLAAQFFALDRARQQVGAGPASVDSLLALFTDDAVYEHPRIGIRIVGKPALRTGMLDFLGQLRNDRSEVRRQLMGRDVVLLDIHQQFEARDDERWVAVTRQVLTVLEVSAGRISRVIDYW